MQEDAFVNLLAQTMGVQKVSLRYVVRPANPPADFASTAEERMFQLPLAGASYETDNSTVYRLLKSFLIDGPGWTWIEPFDAMENGRAAFQAWIDHYNGQGELSKRVQLAKAKINQLHYKNERSMPFEHYQTLLTKCILTLRKSDEDALSPRQEVDALLKGFKTQDPELASAKAVIRDRYARDLTGACAYLGALIASVHGAEQLEAQRYRQQRKRQISAVNGRGRGGRGRGRGRYGGRSSDRNGRGGGNGGRGGGRGSSNVVFNGVDVTDVTRQFTGDEWNNMGPNGRAYVNCEHERRNTGRGTGGDRTGRGGS